MKSQSREQIKTVVLELPIGEMPISCTIQEYDNDTTVEPHSSHKSGCNHSQDMVLTRGFNCGDLTWKLLVFWKTGHSGDQRWLQLEV